MTLRMLSFFVLALFISAVSDASSKRLIRLPDEYQGTWLSPVTGEWHYGLYERFAVVKGRFWQYKDILKKGDITFLKLIDKNEECTLALKKVNKSTLFVGGSLNKLEPVTQEYISDPNYSNYDTTGLSAPFLRSDTLFLHGIVENYDAKRIANIVITKRSLLGERQIELITPDSLGRFAGKVTLTNPQKIMVAYGSGYLTTVYGVPGKHVSVILMGRFPKKGDDYYEKTRQPAFSGQLGLLNTELSLFNKQMQDSFSHTKQRQQENPAPLEEFHSLIKERAEKAEYISAYALRHKCSKAFLQIAQTDLTYATARNITSLISSVGNKREDALEKAYWSYLKKLKFNNDSAFVSSNYQRFISSLSTHAFSLAFGKNRKKFAEAQVSMNEIFGRMIEKRMIRSQDDVQFLLDFFSFKSKSKEEKMSHFTHNRQRLSNLSAIYRESISSVRAEIISEKGIKIHKITQADLIKEVGVDAGIGAEVMMACLLLRSKTDPSLTDVLDTADLKSNIRVPILKEVLLLSDSATIKKDFIDQLPGQLQDLKRFRGYLLYVDFWAPWCGPCIQNMQYSRILQEHLKDKPVKFVYLGVRCSRKSWEEAIKKYKIDGLHYLLNDNEYNALAAKLDIDGIPRYVIIDADGNIINPNAPSPGGVEGELLKLTTK